MRKTDLIEKRNMLAIKFHHIRILIHRPYLCYPHLDRQKDQAILPEQHAVIRDYGTICIAEAQAIAHLMHNVTDTTEIVLNYPWWQMVSCLVAAASVLVLAENFAKYEEHSEGNDLGGAPGLSEDVDTCVHVLHALSGRSNGAKLACTMIRSLRARSAHTSVDTSVDSSDMVLPGAGPEVSGSGGGKLQDSQKGYSYCGDVGASGSGLAVGQVEDVALETNIDDRLPWPMMVPDWMNWSTEFLESFQGPEDCTQSFNRV